MKKRILAVAIAISLLLTGCNLVDLNGYFSAIQQMITGNVWVDFRDMTYERPSEAEFQEILDESCRVAAEAKSVDEVIDQIWTFYSAYDQIATMYYLSEIYYCKDLTDTEWQQEHTFCMNMSNTASEALDTFYRALAASLYRQELESDDYFGPGYFDSYEGESVWDETFQDLMAQEAQLKSRYYELSGQGQDSDDDQTYLNQDVSQFETLFVQLVALRQQIADYAGYDSYPEFAYDWSFYRDYTPAQAMALLEQIQQELPPLYCEIEDSGFWEQDFGSASSSETMSYVRHTADAMGGTVKEAFHRMEEYHLYDIAYSPNKFDNSFEVYLRSYNEPFLFLSPTGSVYDCLSLAHEFGHLCNDYASYGSVASADVAEVFSQGMEYLSLCYGDGPELLTEMKLADCLDTYVLQAAYAAFEHQVYGLTGDDLTTEAVAALYGQIMEQYGLSQWTEDGWEYVTVPHFYTDPMYIVSYVVSNDVAFQLYQQEQAEPGAGLAVYEENLETKADGILEFVEQAGLESPFAPGRTTAVAKTLREILA